MALFLFQIPTKIQNLQYFSRSADFSKISQDSGGKTGLHPSSTFLATAQPLLGTDLVPREGGVWVASNGQTHQPHPGPRPEALPFWGTLNPQLLGWICGESQEEGFYSLGWGPRVGSLPPGQRCGLTFHVQGE